MNFFGRLKLDNLLNKERKIVEKKKLIFLIPVAFVLAAVIVMSVFWGVTGSPLNLGVDYTGGYVVQVNTGTRVNDDNYEHYKALIQSVMDDYEFVDKDAKDTKTYTIVPGEIGRMGSGQQASIRAQFRFARGISKSDISEVIEDLSEDIADKINAAVGVIKPAVVKSGLNVTATYDIPITDYVEDGSLTGYLKDAGINAVVTAASLSNGNKTITFTLGAEANEEAVISALTILDTFTAKAQPADNVSGSVSAEIMINILMMLLLSLIPMFAYVLIRYDLASAVTSIISLLHNMIIMFAFMTMFHIQFSYTFLAALLAVWCYSVISSVFFFERIKENRRAMLDKDKNITSNDIANRSVVSTLPRQTAVSCAILVLMGVIAIVCAIGGISGISRFALAAMAGVAAAFYSSVWLSPAIWAMMRKNNIGSQRAKLFENKNKQNAVKAATAPESVHVVEETNQ